jgi:hypothetical protein
MRVPPRAAREGVGGLCCTRRYCIVYYIVPAVLTVYEGLKGGSLTCPGTAMTALAATELARSALYTHSIPRKTSSECAASQSTPKASTCSPIVLSPSPPVHLPTVGIQEGFRSSPGDLHVDHLIKLDTCREKDGVRALKRDPSPHRMAGSVWPSHTLTPSPPCPAQVWPWG